MLLDQSARQIALYSPLGEEKTELALRSFIATEQISQLFQIDAELISEDFNISFKKIVGQNVSIRMNTIQGDPRFFNGHVRAFRQVGNVGRLASYQAVIVPKLWFLTRSADCRIFQNKKVPDIIKEVLEPYNFSKPFEDTLTATYGEWEYCVQYRETDFNFVSRLMEQEGIHYYFRHEKGKHTMVLADGNSTHKPFPKYDTVPFQGTGHDMVNKQIMRDWAVTMEVQPSFYKLTDFDFKKPKTSLLSNATVLTEKVEGGEHEIFDYPGEYTELSDGEQYALARINELNTQFKTAQGQGDARGICVGCEFTLEGSDRHDQDGKYLVTSSVIQASAESYFSDGGDTGGAAFSCGCTAMQASDVSFFPPRVTPKPIIQGTQTAIVTGPAGDEIHTDKYGRVKVQFHWDRKGKHDENTTCFIRVSELWAGRRWGSTFTPRIGQEVIVAFLEGDPDQPIIIGSVYNGVQMPPYLGDGPDPKHKHDPNVSGIKSCSTKGGNGYNELRFDDTKGKEQIFVHAEKDLDVRVKNSVRETVGGNIDLTVGYEDKGTVTTRVHDNLTLWIGRNFGMQADYESYQSVGPGGECLETKTKDGSHNIKTDKEFTVLTGSVVIQAEEICLTAGSSFIKLTPEGIYINGPMIYINSGGVPSAVTSPSHFDPVEPDHADESKPGSPSN